MAPQSCEQESVRGAELHGRAKAFCSILAGGIGKRMGGGLPKQFILLKGVPIIIRTLRSVLACDEFTAVAVAVHPEWESEFCRMLSQYGIDQSRIVITYGGHERHDSILNTLLVIKDRFAVSEEDVVVVHDAVRPFVSKKVLLDSIAVASKFGACVATLPAVDTMLVVKDGNVTAVPRRAELYHGQAPDSARLLLLERSILALSPVERKTITGTAQICILKGIPVRAIDGDSDNIKITTPHDMEVAERILEKRGEL